MFQVAIFSIMFVFLLRNKLIVYKFNVRNCRNRFEREKYFGCAIMFTYFLRVQKSQIKTELHPRAFRFLITFDKRL